MWSKTVAAVASLGLVPAYQWLRQRMANQSRKSGEREAYKPMGEPQAMGETVKKGGAAGGVPEDLARRGAMQAAGFAPGEPEPISRPAVQGERVEFQPKERKGEELPIFSAPWPLM